MGRWRRKRLTAKHFAIEVLHAKCLNNGVYFYPRYDEKKFKPVIFHATRSWNKTFLKWQSHIMTTGIKHVPII